EQELDLCVRLQHAVQRQPRIVKQTELRGAPPGLVEQARVVQRAGGVAGKQREQARVVVIELVSRVVVVDGKHANQFTGIEHRHLNRTSNRYVSHLRRT